MAGETKLPVRLVKIADLEQAIEVLSRITDREILFWRGHADAQWSLVPQVFRPPHQGIEHRERALLAHFRGGAKPRSSICPPSDDLASWLFMAQHYGLPTRLLDWSESPLVAAFFATEPNPTHDEKDACLWALQASALNVAMGSRAAMIDIRENVVQASLEIAFGRKMDAQLPPAVAIDSPHWDQRMMAQLARFTLHAGGADIREFGGQDKYLFQFIIPAAAKRDFQTRLSLLGIRRSMLFPDLASLAVELRNAGFD